MKKAIGFILLSVVLFSALTSSVFADSAIMPRYNNISACSSLFDIIDNTAYISINYMGAKGICTGATINIKLQKRVLLLFWSTENEWITTTYVPSFDEIYTYPVASGTYRVTIEFTIRGSAGPDDVISQTHEKSN